MDVQVLYTEECGHCRHALETVAEALEDLPEASLEAVDVAEHPEAAEAHDLRCCPGLVVDGDLAYVGVPSQAELRDRLDDPGASPDDPTFTRRYESAGHGPTHP